MKRFKFLLLALLIAELACVALFAYDAYTFHEQGEWQLFPVMNMRKYPRERIGMYPYPNLSASSAYAETLPLDSRFLQLTEIENRVLSASFFCIPLYSLLLALLKRKPEKGSLLLCLLNTAIAIAVAVFIHSYLRDTYGAFYANEYFPSRTSHGTFSPPASLYGSLSCRWSTCSAKAEKRTKPQAAKMETL